LYDAVAQWKSQRYISVDSTSLAFFRDLYPSVKAQRYNSNSQEFTRITNAVTAYADSFVSIAEKYTPADGSLAEQFDRNTGVPLSAVDLTWSYAAFVTMSQRRAGQYPYSWTSNSANTPPATCAASSTPGVYSPATAAGAPNVTSSCQIAVQFNVNASTYFGENIYVIGSTDDLGAWNIDNALPMNAGKYTVEQPLWFVDAMLTAGETVSYKFVREENCGQAPIYESGNRTVTVPACGYSGTVVVEDAWVGKTGSSGGC
jgi:glucoamylase